MLQTQGPQTESQSATPRGAVTSAGDSRVIEFLERRVKEDPLDVVAYNRLADRYLARLRKGGDFANLDLAYHAAQASLAAVPARFNPSGLAALARAEFDAHQFALARDHARALIELEGEKVYPYLLLGDALLELGDYEQAAEAFHEGEQRAENRPTDLFSLEVRHARLAALHGDAEGGRARYAHALAAILEINTAPADTVAWCHWQLGEAEFSVGQYEKAERHFRDALRVVPRSLAARTSLGRVRAARGDGSGAIEHYQAAVAIRPSLRLLAALGDLYEQSGHTPEARDYFARAEKLGHPHGHTAGHGHRNLSLFYADHDRNAELAYRMAKADYEVRQDIYGADALAWTALKAGKLADARAAMKAALRLGTQDAQLYYHAGMIARATGDRESARKFLASALKLSPEFDPRQARIARKTLEECVPISNGDSRSETTTRHRYGGPSRRFPPRGS